MIRGRLKLAADTTTTVYKKHIIIKTIYKDKKLFVIKDPQQNYWVIITKHDIIQFISKGRFTKKMLNVLSLLEERWTIRRVIDNDKPGHPFAHPLNQIKEYFPFGPEEPPINEVKGLLAIIGV